MGKKSSQYKTRIRGWVGTETDREGRSKHREREREKEIDTESEEWRCRGHDMCVTLRGFWL